MAWICNPGKGLKADISGLELANTEFLYHGVWVYWPAAVNNSGSGFFGCVTDTTNGEASCRIIHNTGLAATYWLQSSAAGATKIGPTELGDLLEMPTNYTNKWQLWLTEIQLDVHATPAYRFACKCRAFGNGLLYQNLSAGNLANATDFNNIDLAMWGGYSTNGTTIVAPGRAGTYIADAFLIHRTSALSSQEIINLTTMVPHLALDDPSEVVGHWELDGNVARNYGTLTLEEIGSSSYHATDSPNLIRALAGGVSIRASGNRPSYTRPWINRHARQPGMLD